jgi:uncharacterized protein (TIGR02646 family)
VRKISPIPDRPHVLKSQESIGSTERANAIAHYSSGGSPVLSFKFTVYKNKAIRLALLKAFDYVCAYCEAPVGSIEVEHYRPKGEIRTDVGQHPPGYYWLASTWENLLPSCHDCNVGVFRWEPDGSFRKSGKGNWFPLEDESMRARNEGEESRERPKLLHPYYDEPACHLEFIKDGVVRPRLDATRTPSDRGATTIELIGLNRRGLAEARRDRWIVLRATLRQTLEAERTWRADPTSRSLEDAYRHCVADLEALIVPRAGFSSMAAQVLGLV